jgi:putative oxidoreductase
VLDTVDGTAVNITPPNQQQRLHSHMTKSGIKSAAQQQTMWSHWSPYVLSLVRIVVALMFFEHGLSRLFGFPQPLPTPAPFSLYWFAGAIEFAGGTLLLVGLATRAAAFVMSGEMAFAYFISHAPHSFFPILNRGDSAILYCFVFLYLVFAGGGPLSLDAWLSRRGHSAVLKPAE